MNYKKILAATVIAVGIMSCSSVFASDEPVLLNPARVQGGETPPSAPKATTSKGGKTKTISAKIQYNRYKKVKKVAPKKVNYNQIDKLIENSYYDKADAMLQNAMCANSKDVKAKALWVVSLAKQLKLDPAQAELNELLKTNPKSADLHYAQGIVHYKRTTSSNMIYLSNTQKLFEDSYSEFKKAIALDSKDARYYNAAGVAALNLDKYDEAKKYFQKAVQLDCKSSTAIDNLGTIDFAEGKLGEAEKKFTQALKCNTQNTTAMYHLAQVAVQKQDYGKALYHLNNALAINENSATTYNLMGEIYERQGNEPAAINAYKKSIMVKPEFPMPYFNLAGIYENRGDGEFAIEQLKTALSVNPDFNDARLKIADISLANGKYNQAIENYSALVNVKEYHADALKGLAAAYFEQAQVASTKSITGSKKDLFKAFDSISKAVEAAPEDLELHLAKLKLARITGQPAMSEEELNKIIQSPEADLISLVVKGEAYLTLSNYVEAKKNFGLASASAKELEDKMYLAEILVYHKQFDSAKEVLQSILKETKPEELLNQQATSDLEYIKKSENASVASLKSAQYYIAKKNTSLAVEYLSRSLSFNPNNAGARFALAQIQEQQKNYAEALANYKAYLGLNPGGKDAKKIEKKISHLADKK